MKGNLNAIIFGLAIIGASFFLGKAYVERSQKEGELSVTGSGQADFTSDLIVWEGQFSAENYDLKQAYLALEEQKETILTYLTGEGVKSSELVFSAVQTNQRSKTKYSDDGKYMGEEFVGYELRQSIQIESKEVGKVEQISRKITELLNQGVQLYSEAPRYYYTKLADLKIEMISKATEDAKLRAEKIASYSGGKLGKLASAKLGVFQITGQNSTEDYSWGGTYNTSAKEKTASITVKLDYKVK